MTTKKLLLMVALIAVLLTGARAIQLAYQPRPQAQLDNGKRLVILPESKAELLHRLIPRPILYEPGEFESVQVTESDVQLNGLSGIFAFAGGEQELLDELAEQLNLLGFRTKWLDGVVLEGAKPVRGEYIYIRLAPEYVVRSHNFRSEPVILAIGYFTGGGESESIGDLDSSL